MNIFDPDGGLTIGKGNPLALMPDGNLHDFLWTDEMSRRYTVSQPFQGIKTPRDFPVLASLAPEIAAVAANGEDVRIWFISRDRLVLKYPYIYCRNGSVSCFIQGVIPRYD